MNKVTQAIENDSIAALKSLMKEGIDLNKPLVVGEEYDLEEYDEITPLFYAIRSHASLALIEMMLENGVNLFQTDADGISALDTAIKFKHKPFIALCIQKGFDLNSTKRKSGITPVMLAACFSDTEMMQMLLDAGGKMDITDAAGMTPVAYARKLGQREMQTFLEERGATQALYKE